MPSRGQGRGEGRQTLEGRHDLHPQQRVNTILRKLGEPLYRNFLKATFGPRKGPDGRDLAAADAKAVEWLTDWEKNAKK
jgi:hypothetical protein